MPDALYDKSGKSRKHSFFGASFRPLPERARSSADVAPAQYVRPYVRRSKTDAADCLAMIEAARAIDLKPAPIKQRLI